MINSSWCLQVCFWQKTAELTKLLITSHIQTVSFYHFLKQFGRSFWYEGISKFWPSVFVTINTKNKKIFILQRFWYISAVRKFLVIVQLEFLAVFGQSLIAFFVFLTSLYSIFEQLMIGRSVSLQIGESVEFVSTFNVLLSQRIISKNNLTQRFDSKRQNSASWLSLAS